MCDPLAGEAAQPQKKVPRVGDWKVVRRSACLTTDLWSAQQIWGIERQLGFRRRNEEFC